MLFSETLMFYSIPKLESTMKVELLSDAGGHAESPSIKKRPSLKNLVESSNKWALIFPIPNRSRPYRLFSGRLLPPLRQVQRDELDGPFIIGSKKTARSLGMGDDGIRARFHG